MFFTLGPTLANTLLIGAQCILPTTWGTTALGPALAYVTANVTHPMAYNIETYTVVAAAPKNAICRLLS